MKANSLTLASPNVVALGRLCLSDGLTQGSEGLQSFARRQRGRFFMLALWRSFTPRSGSSSGSGAPNNNNQKRALRLRVGAKLCENVSEHGCCGKASDAFGICSYVFNCGLQPQERSLTALKYTQVDA